MKKEMRRKSYEIDMCNGPLLSRILLFAFPLMCSGILQLLFNAADIIVVGQFVGSDAMAAVGSTSSLISLLVNFFIGISVGANVLVARFYGGGDVKDARETVQTALVTGLIGGCILVVLGIVASRPMLTLMATPAEVLTRQRFTCACISSACRRRCCITLVRRSCVRSATRAGRCTFAVLWHF